MMCQKTWDTRFQDHQMYLSCVNPHPPRLMTPTKVESKKHPTCPPALPKQLESAVFPGHHSPLLRSEKLCKYYSSHLHCGHQSK